MGHEDEIESIAKVRKYENTTMGTIVSIRRSWRVLIQFNCLTGSCYTSLTFRETDCELVLRYAMAYPTWPGLLLFTMCILPCTFVVRNSNFPRDRLRSRAFGK